MKTTADGAFDPAAELHARKTTADGAVDPSIELQIKTTADCAVGPAFQPQVWMTAAVCSDRILTGVIPQSRVATVRLVSAQALGSIGRDGTQLWFLLRLQSIHSTTEMSKGKQG